MSASTSAPRSATSATVTGVDPARGVLTIPSELGGKSVVSFGKTFSGKENVTRVTIPAGVTAIADQAFLNCKNLKGVTINATKMTAIGYQAFMGCSNMEKFVIPNSVTTLGKGVFSGCSALEEVTIGDGVTTLTGVDFTTGGIGSNALNYNESFGSDGALNGMFCNCTSLKTINWGKGLKTIGNIAFLGCTALDCVTIPENVNSIGCHAFYNCASLKNVTVVGKIDYIGRRAFGNCPYLHYVDFQGASMAYNPGAEIFAFDKDRVTVYAAQGSTGWTGVADVGGLPASGKWSGATIVYEPVDPMMNNPYDFYPHAPTFRVSNRDKTWKAPMIVTGSPYLTTQTDPSALTNEIYFDDPIYLSFCVNEYWRGESAENLTMVVNPTRNLAETDYSNNETSITFKVVKRPPVKVTLNRNGGSGGTVSLAAVEYLEPMPTITAPTKSGSVFFGYWTDASWSGAGVQYYAVDGSGVRNSDLKSATTLYARWVKTNEVVFLANGGTGDMPALQVKSGVVHKLPPCAFTPPEGKTFAGWVCSNGRRYDDEVLVFDLGGVTMTAIWK